jgi:hypothetical protein
MHPATKVVSQAMQIEHLAYWLEFGIPAGLIFLGCITQKLIDKEPFNRTHFFIGLDLTIYFLSACLINVIDLTKAAEGINKDGLLFTAGLTTVAILTLFFQVAVHQEWEDEAKGRWGQIIWLCVLSNGIGILLIYGFVRFKLRGTI